jgi:hypothetical protein
MMAEQTKSEKSDKKRKFDEEEEQATAKDEPMGSVAAAVPRDAGSAVNHDAACKENSAPPHKGGHATLVAGTEAHQADKSGKKKVATGKPYKN